MRRGDRGGLLAVACLNEPFAGEQPDGLQQPVPQGCPGGLGHDQALVHQRAKQAGHLQHVQVTGPAHRLGGGQAEAAAEHRQASQQHPLRRGQQRIGPADCAGRPAAVRAASPQWIPIRTRTCSPLGQACAAMACCISSTAATQPRGEANTAKNPSPCVSTSRPSCATSADRISA